MQLDTPISSLYGVGQKMEKYLNSAGLFCVEDLLYYRPRAYQNRGEISLLWDTPLDNQAHSFILTIATEPKAVTVKGRLNLLKFRAFDDSGSVNITYFNQNYLKDVFNIGGTFRFWGKLNQEKRTLSMASPIYEPCIPSKPLPDLVPIYKLFSGVNQKYLSKLQAEIHGHVPVMVHDYLPERIRRKNELCTLAYALQNIHFPEDAETLDLAIKRLTYDELFCFALSLSRIKTEAYKKDAPVMKDVDVLPLISSLSYELTDAQKRVIKDISLDMCPSFDKIADDGTIKPMNRIVVGDVGCGKTVCAAAAAYIACKNSYQCALMVPTEILAVQHFDTLFPMFEKLGFKCELLTGSTPAKAKKEILSRLKTGEIDFIIGTHALIQDNVEFASLGLVITDEQHRFGVMQRARLAEKSKSAHVLVMSATPIPRTLSLMFYGDLDISLIDEMPKGRQRVDTFAVDESYRARLNNFIRKQVENKNQVYIVCPTVEEKKDDIENDINYNPFDIAFDDEPQLKAAVDYAKDLGENVFPDLKVGFIHGKMKGKEKDAIMMDFQNRNIDILVSTTVIEVGVNVPNATLMIVENAERFGLSQLHQLRGRVGRGNDKSYCILVSNSKGEKSKERLEIMHKVYDGYTIAEYDLKMRGPGDFFSSSNTVRQSGDSGFDIACSCTDTELLHTAFEDAKALLSSDPDLQSEQNALLRQKIDKICATKASTIN